MNSHKTRFWPSRMRPALRCLALLLFPGLAPDATLTRARVSDDWRGNEPVPYLTAIGPPAMRFRDPEPVAESAVRIVAVGPPVPGLNATEAVVAVANATALHSTDASRGPRPSQEKTPITEPPAVPARPAPPAVLPDEVSSQVHPEDLLPYFQPPGALPPSAATYTHTPK